jgi:hypothetical protein
MSEYPALVIASNIVSLQQNISSCGIIVNVVINREELQDFIREYSGITLKEPVALSNISALRRYHSKLLKFVEETTIPLVCLASEDNISSILLSRFKTVKKYPTLLKREADSLRFVKESFADGSVTDEELVRHAVSSYPLNYFIGKSDLPVRDRIRQFFV